MDSGVRKGNYTRRREKPVAQMQSDSVGKKTADVSSWMPLLVVIAGIDDDCKILVEGNDLSGYNDRATTHGGMHGKAV